MMVACLPTSDSADAVGAVNGVQVLVWDGTGEPPDGIEQTEFYLGAYMGGPLAEQALTKMPALKVIQLLSAGVEPWLPIVPTGVTLCNGRGVHGGSTAELAVAGLLAVLRGLPRYRAEQLERRWSPEPGEDLDGRRVIVLGAGDIGRRVATALAAFDADCVLVARTARDDVRAMGDLPSLLPEAAAVVVALPLTDDTRGLVDATFLAALPDAAIVVNVSRGGHVDQPALLAELRAGRLRAFLDVADPEPLPPEHELWDAPNLLLTPHVGGGTSGWRRRGYRLVREQLERYARGEELINVVGDGY